MCSHDTVVITEQLCRRETREEPAEYITWIICAECGAELDGHQVDKDTIVVYRDK